MSALLARPSARCCSLVLAPTRLATRRLPPRRLRHAAFSTSPTVAVTPRRSNNFNSGFSSSYDPSHDAPRGPIFSKTTFGVPQFYPRDLKRRVDDYVVGQDRAKKTICSVIFNHYQGLRRRQHHETQDQRLREKLQRQRFAQDRDAHDRGYSGSLVHPAEGGRRPPDESLDPPKSPRQWADRRYHPQDEFPPGAAEYVRAAIGLSEDSFDEMPDDLFIREDADVPQHVKIDKSNILLIGPTGVGKTYILE